MFHRSFGVGRTPPALPAFNPFSHLFALKISLRKNSNTSPWKTIRTRFDDGIHNSAIVVAELCGSVLGKYIELPDCIWRRRESQKIV
jgi:hypothetical protein